MKREITEYDNKVYTVVNYVMKGIINKKSAEEMFAQAREKAGEWQVDSSQYKAAEKEVKSILKNPARVEEYKMMF